jgi:outer membrane protein assembly factor BamA
MRRFVLLALFAAAAVLAQSRTYSVHAVRVIGSKLYDEKQLAKACGIVAGKALTEKQLESELEQAQKRLLETGAVSNVSYRYGPSAQGGFDVTFEVVDHEQRIRYRFEALEIDEPKARAFLREKEPLFGDLIPASERVTERFRRHVAEFLKADVKARVETDRDGNLGAIFLPAAGLPAVAEVSFTGNQVLTTTVLQNAIHGVAVGTIWREDRFRELLQSSLVPLYESRGRLRVKFPKVEAKRLPTTDVLGVAVAVTVDEGDSFTIGAVQAAGTPDNDGLAKAAALKSGNVANYDEVREGQRRLHAALRRAGFMKVNSKIEPEIQDKTKEVNILYRVDMGPRFAFDRMETRGLDLHGEHEIRRLWTMAKGDPFNADYPGYFLNRLREDGIFDGLENARAEIDANEKDRTVRVTLIFNERRGKKPGQP